MPTEELDFCCGLWGVRPAGEGQPQMDTSLPSPGFASLSTLETECSLVVGREKLTLKIKQAPGHLFCPQRRQIHRWGMAGRKLMEEAMWMLLEPPTGGLWARSRSALVSLLLIKGAELFLDTPVLWTQLP